MNIIDIILLGMVLLYVLNGFYRGFLSSIANLGGFIISWISALIFFKPLSNSLAVNETVASFKFYIEGAENVGNVELARTSIYAFSEAELSETITKSAQTLVMPFRSAVIKNVTTHAFEEQGLTTIGEYYDETIYRVILNIIAFIIIFVIVRIIVTLLINSFTYASDLPELRHFDRTLGGAVSLARAFLSMYVVFAVVPIALMLVPVQFVIDTVNSSFMTGIFYNGSILLPILG